jgi:hypothetical protein
MRLCITGGPKTGKTTMASRLHESAEGTDTIVVNCDKFIETHSWSGASEHVAWLMIGSADLAVLPLPDPWIIEGVQVARALRKAMALKPGVKPCDKLIVLTKRHGTDPVLKGHDAMRKGIETVLAEILPDLNRLGVVIEMEKA